jgi:hypothetical protein
VKPDTIVIYIADPLLYGKLLLIGTHDDGRLECEQLHADRNGEFARDLFWPHELEAFDRWAAGRVAA